MIQGVINSQSSKKEAMEERRGGTWQEKTG